MNEKVKVYPYRFCPHCGNPLERRKVEGRYRLWCPVCARVIYMNPVPVVATVLLDDRNRVLLIKRGVPPKKGRWALPSSFIDLGEEPEKAALRELEEETGLKGTILKLLGVYKEKSPRYKSVLVIGYLVMGDRGNPVPGDDAQDAKFFEEEKLPSVPFESHRKFIRESYEILKGRDSF